MMKLDVSFIKLVAEVRVGPGNYQNIEITESDLNRLVEQLAQDQFVCFSKPVVQSITTIIPEQ